MSSRKTREVEEGKKNERRGQEKRLEENQWEVEEGKLEKKEGK